MHSPRMYLAFLFDSYAILFLFLYLMSERFLKGDKHISTLELVHESRYLDGTRMVTGTREELKQ